MPRFLVENYQMLGASISNLVITFLLLIFLVIPFIIQYNKACKKGFSELITDK